MKVQWFPASLLVLSLLVALALAPSPCPVRAEGRQVTANQAITATLNNLQATADGYLLRHPRHTATFTPGGLVFRPWTDGPSWTWRLTAVTAGGNSLTGVDLGDIHPVSRDPLVVAYPRGAVVEQYLAKTDAIEQQFLIPQPLPLDGADLVIAGAVQAEGDFVETEDGWRWHTSDGSVHLGRVTVYDAQGTVLPATMTATANSTHITVDGAALAQAAYPVTVDPELGYDRILSSMGPYTDPDYDALNPAVAYNSQDNRYLVVWSGTDDVIGEYEIWGQVVRASDGAQYGADFQISFMGLADDPDYDAEDPDVVYNSDTNEYLVVWSADHYADGDYEIWARRVGADGTLLGSMARVSVMGPGVDPNYDAMDPAVAYNSGDNQYLVVWEGDHDAGTLANNEYEIWARRLNASAEAIEPFILRLSDLGTDGNASYDARDPDVAYSGWSGYEYLVVWEGDHDAGLLENDEFEIWGQQVNAAGIEVGTNDFRISDMGGTGNADLDALDPAVAYNSGDDEYLVVWEGDDYTPDEFDIYGQRLLAFNCMELPPNDFVVSNPGNGPNANYDALNPAVAYDQYNNEYLVVWQDDELGVGEFEIFGQRINAATGASIDWDTRLSDMGPEGDAFYIAQTPAIAYSGMSNNQYLVVWSGDNSTDGEFEIWAQRFTGGFKVFLPIVLGDYP
jgi:hypothetical protein